MTLAFRLSVIAALAASPIAIHAAPALAANATDATMFPLESVTFVGNQQVSTETLEAAAGLHKGDRVNRDSIVQAFQNVVAAYGKANVGGKIQPTMSIVHNRMQVVFNIDEAAAPPPVLKDPVLDHETITGNAKVTSEQLAGALTIKPGTPVTVPMIIADRDAISAVYKAAHVAANIKPKANNLPEGHVDLNFEIVENPPPAKK